MAFKTPVRDHLSANKPVRTKAAAKKQEVRARVSEKVQSRKK
jgi:hypothetical protein